MKAVRSSNGHKMLLAFFGSAAALVSIWLALVYQSDATKPASAESQSRAEHRLGAQKTVRANSSDPSAVASPNLAFRQGDDELDTHIVAVNCAGGFVHRGAACESTLATKTGSPTATSSEQRSVRPPERE
jgi:hypothetical protein